jgi:hypothetical protein
VVVTESNVSLRAPRTSLMNYLGDYYDWIAENGIGWIYYPYRDVYQPGGENLTSGARILGIYSCPSGTPTSDCTGSEDTAMVDFLKARFAK